MIAIVFVSRKTDSAIWNRLWTVLAGRSTSFDVSQPTVVNRIQQLHRLETVVYTMDKVVTGEKNNPLLPDFLAGDRLLLLVHGEVIAGIDFGGLKPDQVKLSAKTVRLHLPDAQLFTLLLQDAGLPEKATLLVAIANNNGGRDNVSVVLARASNSAVSS